MAFEASAHPTPPGRPPAENPFANWLATLGEGGIRNTPGSFATPQAAAGTHAAVANDGKIHVAFILPWMIMGGADGFNLSLLAGLDKARYRVSVVTTHPADNTWQQRFAAVTPDIYTLPSLLDIDQFPTFLSAFIQSQAVDVLFVSNSEFGYASLPWLRCQFPSLAVVDYVHAPDWRIRAGGFARTAAAYGEVLDKTCVCNAHTRGEMIDRLGCPPETVETVYIGVDEAHFDPAMIAPGQAYSQLGIDPTRPIVLFPCRTAPQKRPLLMLAIARQMAEAGSPTAFVVVGDGPDFEQMQHYVRQHQLEQTVYFAGPQADVRPYYRDAALTLICSSFEGLSLTAYESMAMATPVVTSDVGGQAELVNDDNGAVLPLLVAEGEGPDAGHFIAEEVALYATAIQRLLANPQDLARRGALCRQTVIEGFSLAGMVRQMDALFTQLTTPAATAARAERYAPLAGYARLCTENLLINIEYLKARTALEEGQLAAARTQGKLAGKAAAAQQELSRIHSMRSFRLANRYAAFMARFRRRGQPPETPQV